MNSHQRQLVVVFVAVCLSGCATRPPQVLTPELVPKAFGAHAAPKAPVWPRAGWWHEFRSPELSNLIVLAQADNRNIAAAAARLREARAEVTIQRAALFPQVDLAMRFVRALAPPLCRQAASAYRPAMPSA
jgi:outer membrane protein TolC